MVKHVILHAAVLSAARNNRLWDQQTYNLYFSGNAILNMQKMKRAGRTEKKCIQNCDRKSSKGREYFTKTDVAEGKILKF
jgi:hypothetical protein